MKNFILWIFMLLVFFSILFGCKKNNKEFHYYGRVMSKSKFISFLVDLHKTDGVLVSLDFDDRNLKNNDSISYYNYLLKKYNINYMDFLRSLDYYMRNVENFKHLYQIVIDSLKNQMYYLDSLQQLQLSKKNLWKGKQIYIIPFQDNAQDSIPFEYPNPKPGIYELSADISVFEDDQTFDLKMRMIVEYDDGFLDTAETQIYFKDNQYHKYLIKILVENKKRKPVRLYGALLSYTKTMYMHVKIRRIRLIRYEQSEMPWFKRSVYRPKQPQQQE